MEHNENEKGTVNYNYVNNKNNMQNKRKIAITKSTPEQNSKIDKTES